MKRLWVVLLASLTLVVSRQALAQTTLEPFIWTEGHLSLLYPGGWDEPFPADSALQLAQVSAEDPAVRPPGAQAMTLHILPRFPDDPLPALTDALTGWNLVAQLPTGTGTAPGPVATIDSLSGSSADNQMTGMAHVFRLTDGRAALLSGRSLVAAQATFQQQFDSLVGSVVPGAHNTAEAPGYGVEWAHMTTVTDRRALLRLIGADVAANTLYAVDVDQGLVRLDATAGVVQTMQNNDATAGVVDLTVDGLNRMYLAVPDCQCIRILLADGFEQSSISGFNDGMPASVAVTPEGTLYATDWDDEGYFVRVFDGNSWVARLAGVSNAPVLAVNRSGGLLALTRDGWVFELAGTAFQPRFSLRDAPDIRDMDVDLNNNLVIATADEGVIVANSGGEIVARLGQMVESAPQPGQFVSPRAVATSGDGTIYVVDSDGTFGGISAFRPRLQPQRLGETVLVPGNAVQGWLDAGLTEQRWTYDGSAGEIVTISAVEVARRGVLDVAIRLIAPDGSEEAYNDDQLGLDLYGELDAQIAAYELKASGTYTIAIERVAGNGAYSLGINPAATLSLNIGQPTSADGWIQDAVPGNLWQFEAQAGQVITVTMRAQAGRLDPMLRLFGPDGEQVTWNDDAADPEMGKDSQLVLVTLPETGTYTLEATRFDGSGYYTLLVMPN